MRTFLSIFLLSACALNADITPIEHREEMREIFQLMKSQDSDHALEKIHHCLHHTSDKTTKITLLQERALLHLLMNLPQKALDDLDTIISMQPSDEYTFVKALWMHLAISARLQDATTVRNDFELLKKWDKSFPKVHIHHETVYVVSKTNSSFNFYAFTEMLEGFGLRESWEHQLITLNTGYYEAKIHENADHHLVELAAACAFTDSPWGSAACHYIGKTFVPQHPWKESRYYKYTDVTCRDLLRNLK